MSPCISLVLVATAIAAVQPPGGKPADAPAAKKALKTFTNSKMGLAGERAEHFVDFSFDYPADWKLVRVEGDQEKNFVKVERSIVKNGTDNTLESFNVGTFYGKASGNQVVLALTGDDLKLKVRDLLISQLKTDIARGFPGSKVTGEGKTKVGDYDGYELRFAFAFTPKDMPEVKIWGRIILVPNPDGSENGLTVFLIGTNIAPELKEEKDLGVKGELPVILKSFKLGKPKK